MKKVVKVTKEVEEVSWFCDECECEIPSYHKRCDGCGGNFCEKHLKRYFELCYVDIDNDTFCERCAEIQRVYVKSVEELEDKRDALIKKVRGGYDERRRNC